MLTLDHINRWGGLISGKKAAIVAASVGEMSSTDVAR